MATRLDTVIGISKEFSGLRDMVQQTLDSVHDISARQTDANSVLAEFRDHAEATTTTIRDSSARIDNLVRRVQDPGPGVLGGLPATALANIF
jgi:hypothetical protein